MCVCVNGPPYHQLTIREINIQGPYSEFLIVSDMLKDDPLETKYHSHKCVSWQKEEERLRASIRRESQQRRMREKQHQRGLSSSYLEPDRYDDEEEGEEAISLAAIKSKYKGGGGLRGEHS